MKECQLTTMYEIQRRNSIINNFIQLRIPLIWYAKKKAGFLKNKLNKTRMFFEEPAEPEMTLVPEMRAGDMVRVHSKKNILRTLDDRGATGGCIFTPEMYARCGDTYKIYKEISYFYDEVKNRMCKCKNIVILEGALCSGRRKVFSDDCDRCCFQFWHKRWLEKIVI